MAKDTVDFIQMKDGSEQDYLLLHRLETAYIRALPERLVLALARLGGSLQAYPTKPLAHFAPLLKEVFSRAPFDPAVLKEPGRVPAH